MDESERFERDEIGVGSRVTLEYRLETDDGELIEERKGDNPFIFNFGQAETLPAIESVIRGKTVGFQASIGVDANEAYGAYRDDLVVEVPRVTLPASAEIKVGVRFRTIGPDGEQLVVQIVAVHGEGDEAMVTLDGNHPLAGHSLYIDLKVLQVEPVGTGPVH